MEVTCCDHYIATPKVAWNGRLDIIRLTFNLLL